MIQIIDGFPPGYVSLYWLQDLRKFKISLQQLFNPTNKYLGISFLKNGKKKCVIFGGKVTQMQVAKAMRSVEKEFGVPDEASKYADILKGVDT